MITELVLTNFKCFKEETHIPLSKLNIFTGTNGSGKSSAIQALLLLAQRDTNNPEYLPLNGRYTNLGGISEVRHNDSIGDSTISIGLRVKKTKIDNDFTVFNTLSLSEGGVGLNLPENLYIKKIHADFGEVVKGEYENVNFLFDSFEVTLGDNDEVLSNFFSTQRVVYSSSFAWFDDRGYNVLTQFDFEYSPNSKVNYSKSYSITQELSYVYYIPADRIGPKSYYIKSPFTSWTDLGQYGEKTLSILVKKSEQVIQNSHLLPPNTEKTYIKVINYWLSYIFNDLKIDITTERDTIHLTIDGINPTMTGFGYSYVLPIIYTGLAAIKGHTIIIDNPELHLTPKSQSRLMEFLCKVANSGVQVFIETHSDHIINGARVMLREQFNQKAKEDGDSTKGISPDDISILWFENDKESSNTKVTQVEVKENGKYGHVPKGFFDQMDNDLNKILGFTV